jgi:hypothetical protein
MARQSPPLEETPIATESMLRRVKYRREEQERLMTREELRDRTCVLAGDAHVVLDKAIVAPQPDGANKGKPSDLAGVAATLAGRPFVDRAPIRVMPIVPSGA